VEKKLKNDFSIVGREKNFRFAVKNFPSRREKSQNRIDIRMTGFL
jgi:hypothetical protein